MRAVVYFFLVLPTQYLLKKFKPHEAEPPPTKTCPQCLSDIPDRGDALQVLHAARLVSSQHLLTTQKRRTKEEISLVTHARLTASRPLPGLPAAARPCPERSPSKVFGYADFSQQAKWDAAFMAVPERSSQANT